MIILEPFMEGAMQQKKGNMDKQFAPGPVLDRAVRLTLETTFAMLEAGVANLDQWHNIMYAADGTPLFIDLGLAVLLDRSDLFEKGGPYSWGEQDLAGNRDDTPEHHVKWFLLRNFCMLPKEYWENGKIAKWVAERTSHSKWDKYVDAMVSVYEEYKGYASSCFGQIRRDFRDRWSKNPPLKEASSGE